jgi:AraC-like DNA-binding protein
MARWEPGAQGRLQQAAMELFAERGYARTTVEDIAARAGLTERTFFRYFADKREVLFGGSKHRLTSSPPLLKRRHRCSSSAALTHGSGGSFSPLTRNCENEN